MRFQNRSIIYSYLNQKKMQTVPAQEILVYVSKFSMYIIIIMNNSKIFVWSLFIWYRIYLLFVNSKLPSIIALRLVWRCYTCLLASFIL